MNATSERWFKLAFEDLQMAELALRTGIYNQVCFHSQQCIEKCLKGLLVRLGMATPRTHSIVDILGLIPNDYLHDLRGELGQVDIYYIPTRYPDALPGSLPEGLPGKEDAEEAILTARACWREVREKQEKS